MTHLEVVESPLPFCLTLKDHVHLRHIRRSAVRCTWNTQQSHPNSDNYYLGQVDILASSSSELHVVGNRKKLTTDAL